MSRTVIHDIVIPIVSRIMGQQGHFGFGSHFAIEDENLETFLEEEMRKHFGVIGSNGCQHLKEQLEEAKKNDPGSFEYLIERLLDKYIKLTAKLRTTQKTKQTYTGPPDRFLEQFKKARELAISNSSQT